MANKENAQQQTSRLRWHCRRGSKELDKILLHYLEHHYRSASAAEQAVFRRLLETPDPVLWDILRSVPAEGDAAYLLCLQKLRHVID